MKRTNVKILLVLATILLFMFAAVSSVEATGALVQTGGSTTGTGTGTGAGTGTGTGTGTGASPLDLSGSGAGLLQPSGSQTATTYTVTFSSNGGSTVSSQTVNSGSKATKPTDPTKSGSTFAGWYTDNSLTTAYDFSSEVTSNITLYAKWNVNPNTNTTANTTSNYINSNLPNTGDAGDYALFLLIAVGIVVAVYGYRKYTNYNI